MCVTLYLDVIFGRFNNILKILFNIIHEAVVFDNDFYFESHIYYNIEHKGGSRRGGLGRHGVATGRGVPYRIRKKKDLCILHDAISCILLGILDLTL